MENLHLSVHDRTNATVESVLSSVKQVVKAASRLQNRAARFYWSEELPLLQKSRQSQNSAGLDNPLVVAAIVAGVIGVTIIAVLILSLWIRSKVSTMNSSNFRRRSVVSSFSTMDEVDRMDDSVIEYHPQINSPA